MLDRERRAKSGLKEFLQCYDDEDRNESNYDLSILTAAVGFIKYMQ